MKKLMNFIGILFLFMMIVGVYAENQEIEKSDFDFEKINCQDLLQFKEEVVGTVIPSQIPFSNERVNIFIGEEFFGNIIIQESVLTGFSCEKLEDRTYEIYIKEKETLKEIIESENPLEQVNQKIDSGDIVIKGITVGKKVKMFFLKIGLKILGWFS